jgi:copper chaperone CopZ
MTNMIASSGRLSSQQQNASDLICDRQHIDEVNKNTKEVASTMQSPSCGLQIVHASTGRVRIRATDGSSHSILDTIAEELRHLDGVKEVSLNQQTGSLVVTFDENKLSLAQMLGVELHSDINQEQGTSESASKNDPFAVWKSFDFWKEQGLSIIPLMTGLAVTGKLGLRGFAAIPVYMVAADATRRVIDFIGLQIAAQSSKNSVSATKISKPSLSKFEEKRQSSIQEKIAHLPSLVKVERKSTTSVAEPGKIAYSVVHEIPGRIRFHVPRLVKDTAYGRRLERLLKTDPQVTNVRMNCDAASIAIAYNKSSQMSVSHWANLMELADEAISEINTVNDTIKTTEPQVSLDSAIQNGHPTEGVAESGYEKLTQKRKSTKVQKKTVDTSIQQRPTEAIDSTKASETNLDLTSYWGSFKTPAMSFSLAVMANFPLNPVPD